eukprot:COSAG01_NODE_199_length_22202_cov_23.993668_23_plen_130_part_00
MRVRSHARMEAAVKDVELGVKRMMLANSMPADKWRWMQKSFIWLRRRFPRQRDVVSKDGDAIRPIERISNGEYSRLRCNKELCATFRYPVLGTDRTESKRRLMPPLLILCTHAHPAVCAGQLPHCHLLY